MRTAQKQPPVDSKVSGGLADWLTVLTVTAIPTVIEVIPSGADWFTVLTVTAIPTVIRVIPSDVHFTSGVHDRLSVRDDI